MHGIPLRGKRVVVQRYGETNRELQAALESKGAQVIEIATYRWALPEDTKPLLRLIDALGRDEIDLVAFTSASQASNLFAVAQYDGKEASLKQKSWPNARRFNRPGVQRRTSQARREGRYRRKTAEARAVY
jgi:uroporphyrinogen-III synthase